MFCLFVAFLGTSISWGTWQRTPVQTTRSFSSFQVRGTAVSQFDKHSLILLALCDKNVDGFSLSRFFFFFFHYLFIVRICIKLRNHIHPKSHLLCLSNFLFHSSLSLTEQPKKRSLNVFVMMRCFAEISIAKDTMACWRRCKCWNRFIRCQNKPAS